MIRNRFAFDVLKADVERVGQAMFLIAIDEHIWAGSHDATLKFIAHGGELDGFGGHAFTCKFACFGETNDVGHIFRSRAACTFLMAAEHEWFEFGPAAHIEDANAFGGVELMTAHREKINGNFFDVNGDFTRDLHGIGMKRGTIFAADFRDLFDGEDGAGFVVGPHNGNERVLRAFELIAQLIKIDLPDRIDGELDFIVAHRFEAAAGLQDGGMFNRSRDNFGVAAIKFRRAADGGVVTFRCTRGEDNFVRFAIEEGGNLFAGLVEMVCDLPTKSMH